MTPATIWAAAFAVTAVLLVITLIGGKDVRDRQRDTIHRQVAEITRLRKRLRELERPRLRIVADTSNFDRQLDAIRRTTTTWGPR